VKGPSDSKLVSPVSVVTVIKILRLCNIVASVALGAPSLSHFVCAPPYGIATTVYSLRDRHGPSLLSFPGSPLLEGLMNMPVDSKFTNVMHPQPSLEEPKRKRTKYFHPQREKLIGSGPAILPQETIASEVKAPTAA